MISYYLISIINDYNPKEDELYIENTKDYTWNGTKGILKMEISKMDSYKLMELLKYRNLVNSLFSFSKIIQINVTDVDDPKIERLFLQKIIDYKPNKNISIINFIDLFSNIYIFDSLLSKSVNGEIYVDKCEIQILEYTKTNKDYLTLENIYIENKKWDENLGILTIKQKLSLKEYQRIIQKNIKFFNLNNIQNQTRSFHIALYIDYLPIWTNIFKTLVQQPFYVQITNLQNNCEYYNNPHGIMLFNEIYINNDNNNNNITITKLEIQIETNEVDDYLNCSSSNFKYEWVKNEKLLTIYNVNNLDIQQISELLGNNIKYFYLDKIFPFSSVFSIKFYNENLVSTQKYYTILKIIKPKITFLAKEIEIYQDQKDYKLEYTIINNSECEYDEKDLPIIYLPNNNINKLGIYDIDFIKPINSKFTIETIPSKLIVKTNKEQFQNLFENSEDFTIKGYISIFYDNPIEILNILEIYMENLDSNNLPEIRKLNINETKIIDITMNDYNGDLEFNFIPIITNANNDNILGYNLLIKDKYSQKDLMDILPISKFGFKLEYSQIDYVDILKNNLKFWINKNKFYELKYDDTLDIFFLAY